MKEKLKAFGFSDKEADIFIAVHELGSAVASDIAKRAHINRSTAYVVLDSLAERGLIGVSEKSGINVYVAVSPERLTEYLEGLSKQYKGFAVTAKKLVPELKSLGGVKRGSHKGPTIRVFEGNQGMQTVYEDTLSSLETIRAYASIEDTKKTGQTHVIFPNTPNARKQIAARKEEVQEAFLAPTGNYNFSSEINIYDSKVIFISPAGKVGLIIENREFADTLKKAFQTIANADGKQKGFLSGRKAEGAA
jgi:predicted transcriptional regulator